METTAFGLCSLPSASLRPRIAHMLLIKQLIRSGAITRHLATEALKEGGSTGPGLPRVLLARGWVSPQCMTKALAALREAMMDLH